MPTLREDQTTAAQITEALRIKAAFGQEVALGFLRRRCVKDSLACAALAGRYDRRAIPDKPEPEPEHQP
ncbi:hypothetical protein CR152_27965 [Massilia violaceinigra]|uniref:Uncharacterized protein n=1 Tax=Massilia violaceinigra TaxID=2045208 RepID=A0A2D2DSF2_9BURK|nr:hypothetical protein [Massilia violaceinigra]ATQ77912.1 hypothetical protein CR152_27965 [Massilia violaceinigra]